MQLRNKILAALLSLMVCVSMLSCKTAPAVPEPTPAPAAMATSTATPSPTPTPTPTATPEPNVHDFVPGINDENGYHSDYFRFGFLLPTKFEAKDRSYINDLNEIDSSLTDLETIRKALIMQLKVGEILLDYLAKSTKDRGYLYVSAWDFSSDDSSFESEAEFLKNLGTSTQDSNEIEQYKNFEMTNVVLGGVERVVYRYDVTIYDEEMKGFEFAIKQGATFATIKMVAKTEDELEYALNSFYTLP